MIYEQKQEVRLICRKIVCAIFLICILSLIGCMGDEVRPQNGQLSGNSEGKDTYVSFALHVDPAGLKSLTKTYEGEDVGSMEENYVEKVRIVLYDGNLSSSRVVRFFDFKIRTDESGVSSWIDYSDNGKDLAPNVNQNNNTQFITFARKVPKMAYKMLVIINPTSYLETITNQSETFDQMLQGYKVENLQTKTGRVGDLAKQKYFLMTNIDGLVDVGTDDLYITASAAHNAPVAVKVGRVVSKVTVTGPSGQTTIPANNASAEVGSVKWELDVTNRYTFWMMQRNMGASANREEWYAIDPNYSGTSSQSEAVRNDNFFYYSSLGQQTPMFANNLTQPEYCLENTMDLNEQKQKNVITRVLLRCVYKPKGVNIGSSFYVYGNMTLTMDDMKEYALVAESMPVSQLSDLYKAIIDAKSEGYSFLTGNPVNISTSQSINESFITNTGIAFYYGGVNYYAVKILHFGDSDSDNPAGGHYGVLRNTHYDVAVNKIMGPGSPTILRSDIVTRSVETDVFERNFYNNIEASVYIR